MLFERRLFERSEQSGLAGHDQWGLDVGPLQDGFNPYSQVPSEWSTVDIVEDALEVGAL